jgi:hypothetical protein
VKGGLRLKSAQTNFRRVKLPRDDLHGYPTLVSTHRTHQMCTRAELIPNSTVAGLACKCRVTRVARGKSHAIWIGMASLTLLSLPIHWIHRVPDRPPVCGRMNRCMLCFAASTAVRITPSALRSILKLHEAFKTRPHRSPPHQSPRCRSPPHRSLQTPCQ